MRNLKLQLRYLIAALILIMMTGCASGGGAGPGPQPPPVPPTPTEVWNSRNQVELSWSDMPVTVQGGSESYVLRRRMTISLPVKRRIIKTESFMGFDRGDVLESTVALYAADGQAIYRRSLHKELGNPDCYEAYEAQPYGGPPTDLVFFDLDCRVNGPNEQSGSLSARCHIAATLTFEEE